MGLRLVLFSLLFLYAPTSEGLPVKATVEKLPPVPGYIPVYIQDGDSPPDVESIYDVFDGQSPADDKMDTDVQEEPQRSDADQDSVLRESKDFIVQQLLRGPPRNNEVHDLQELRTAQSQS